MILKVPGRGPLSEEESNRLFMALFDDDTEDAPWMVMGSLQWEAAVDFFQSLRHYAESQQRPWFVAGMTPILYRWEDNPFKKQIAPDVFVALAPNRPRSSYDVEVEGEFPPFVLEVVSPSSADRDQFEKRYAYEMLGAREYALFTPRSDGPSSLEGYRRNAAGQFEPWPADEQGRLWSETLGLYLVARDATLRAATRDGELVPTLREFAARQRGAESAQRAAEEAQRAAEASRKSAEAENERLRREIERLRGQGGPGRQGARRRFNRAREVETMSLDVGLQLFSVREALQRDAAGTIERIAEIGYKHLQPALHGGATDAAAGALTASQLRRQADALGMDIPSVHARVDEQTDWDHLIALNQELGSSAIVVPIAFFTDRASVLDYARALSRYGERCRAHGLEFYYHNHFQEFQVLGGQTVMDLLVDNTDRDLVRFELDTYWAARGGADPVEWLLKLGDRCDLTHQKDLPAAARPVSYFEVFGNDARITLDELILTQDPRQFAEVGEGTMDVPSLLAAMRRIGVRYVFVEQDQSARDEIDSVGISFQNLTRMMDG